jgi:hypothetical protein
MEFKSVQLSGGYPHLKQPLVGAGLCACPRSPNAIEYAMNTKRSKPSLISSWMLVIM